MGGRSGKRQGRPEQGHLGEEQEAQGGIGSNDAKRSNFSSPSNTLFSYPLKSFKTLGLDSQIKGVSAGEAKPGAYGHLPPTEGSEASSTERKSHPNIPLTVPPQDRKPRHGPHHSQASLGKEKQCLCGSHTSILAEWEPLDLAPAREH